MVWAIVGETDEVTSICVMKDVVEVTTLAMDITYHLHEDKEKERERERERDDNLDKYNIIIQKELSKS